MFLIKLIGKILLLPVVLLLAILRLLVKIGMEVSSFILGALMLIVFGCIIFTIVQHTWNSMLILIAIEVFLLRLMQKAECPRKKKRLLQMRRQSSSWIRSGICRLMCL